MNKKHRFIIAVVVLIIAVILLGYYKSNWQLSVQKTAENTSTCIGCHGKMQGLNPLHEQLACVSCHQGSNTSIAPDSAHFNLISIPGNLASAQETCEICHAEAVQHINRSLMTTNSGIIAVDKYIFGEFDSPNTATHIKEIHHSGADEHLRALCSRCHLGSEKVDYGPIDELSRGGGCNACHLNYTEIAKNQLSGFLQDSSQLPNVHPSLDLQISDDHCFGCHSRSGRIATNYQGYHETLLQKDDLTIDKDYKVLLDERVFKYIQEDIHHDRGLACIDCHGYEDVMGDGKNYLHEEDAVKIACEDCHASAYDNTAHFKELSYAQQRIFNRREFSHDDKPIILTAKDSVAIINSFIDKHGKAHLVSKITQEVFDLLSPAENCTREFGHQNLACSSCHTGWAPQCIGCHISYEKDATGYDLLDKKPMPGSWVEYAGSFLSGPPTLGVRLNKQGKDIEPAMPGMIMTLDKGSFTGHASPNESEFYRLFAPTAAHTTTARGRSCTSCHNNPLALGYGRGQLNFDLQTSIWKFTPEYEKLPTDGLPADAWTVFLQEPAEKVSTRLNFRPFAIAEQQKILTVGACLTCHDNSSDVMRHSLEVGFSTYIETISTACRLPEFEN